MASYRSKRLTKMQRPSLLASVFLLLCTAAVVCAQDVVTLGSASGAAGTVISVPVFVRDVSGTALGVDAGAGMRIQGFAFKVTFPAEVVESVAFTRSGVTASLTPLFETTLQGSEYCAFVASFNAGSNPIPFVSNATAPGDQIGTLQVLLQATASVGSTGTLTLHPPSAILSNQAGTASETVAQGTLALVNGTVTVNAVDPLGAPGSFLATAISTSQVNLSWTAVGGADHYQVWRSANGGPFVAIGTPPGTTHSDGSLAAGTTYLYRVRAVGGSGGVSPFSSIDPATTILFADDPLVMTATLVKLIHFSELRTAVNAFRAAAKLAPLPPDPTVAAGATVSAQHIRDLRTGLDQARTAAGLTSLTLTDPTLTAGSTLIRAAHVQELREGVK